MVILLHLQSRCQTLGSPLLGVLLFYYTRMPPQRRIARSALKKVEDLSRIRTNLDGGTGLSYIIYFCLSLVTISIIASRMYLSIN